ncbi:MAG: helix-turn-helix transcriptional regulator [Dehalococcoidales bacterium]|nr:helix-turn-helix transcriptional regulator [Dehalococcoidales bacterium]
MSEQVTLGKRIRKRRHFLQITQRQLSDALKISPQHISFIEKDKGTPSLVLLAKLAEELGVSIDYLVTGKESVVTDTIPAIKADKRLKLKAKKALISFVEELYSDSEQQENNHNN